MTSPMSLLRLPLLSAGLSLFASTASAQVGAPLLGFVPHSGKILPINGIAASASGGTALDFGGNFRRIAISPRQDFALVSSAASGAVLIASPSGTTSAVAGASTDPDQIVLSPNGSAAVLWFGSARRLEVVSGLPSTPAARRFDATFLSGGSNEVPVALAVSDDGAWAAGAWSTGRSGAIKSPGGVWAFGPNGEARRISLPDHIRSLAFFPGREDLALAASSGVYSVTDVGGSASVSTLYTASQTLTPTGLGVAGDGTTVVLADANGAILTVHADSGASEQADCQCSPAGLAGMGNSLFHILENNLSVVRIFDARERSVFLVPLGGPQSGGGSQ